MLEIKNLSFGYKNHLVLNNLSLTLLDNKIGVILGKNGAGKSTLFKNILGILKPNEGSIIIDNINLNTLSRKERAKKISYVPQDNSFGELNVFDSVLVGRLSNFNFFSRYEDEQITKKIIKEMALEKIMNKNVNELSGGEKQ